MCIILFNKNNNKINAYGKYNYCGRLFLNVLCTHQYVSQMRHAWAIACACLCRIDVLTDCDAISELISSSRSLRREGICHVDRQLIF